MRLFAFTAIALPILQALANPIILSNRNDSISTITRRCDRPQPPQDIPKRGICYNNGVWGTPFYRVYTGWGYNWDQTRNGLRNDFDYVPMLWGPGSIGSWHDNAQASIDAGSKYLLFFNEPDRPDQASIDVGASVNLWRKHFERYACRAYLGSPAVSNGGLGWLRDFMNSCQRCTIDFIAVHWYDTATNIEYFKNFLKEVHQIGGGRPIWLTEFGFRDSSMNQIEAFYKQMLPWMDSLDYLQRYAAFKADIFGGMPNLNGGSESNPKLSSLGRVYAST